MKNMYAIWDKKAEAYFGEAIQTFNNDRMASRWFADLLAQKGPQGQQNVFALHPEDYELHNVGLFTDDQINGEMVVTARQCVDVNSQSDEPQLPLGDIAKRINNNMAGAR